MGWTGTHATHYKKGAIDRKAECDYLFNDNRYKVLKSSMVGATYYAAIEYYKDGKRVVFAAVVLTSVDNNSYFNFNYKDLDETMGPCERKCPVSILRLLSPTESEYAIEWRKACYENAEKAKAKKIDPRSLNNLPVGTSITFTLAVNTAVYKAGDKVTLRKIEHRGRKKWYGYGYIWAKTLIPENYDVLSA